MTHIKKGDELVYKKKSSFSLKILLIKRDVVYEDHGFVKPQDLEMA